MSELNKDSEVVENGRKNKLQDVEAPLRDQIVTKLYKKLKDMKVGVRVADMWTTGTGNRSIWNERQLAWLDSWDEHLLSDSSGPFEGSSQLHVPMPLTVVKTMHARFLQALWQDPSFNVKPRNEASTDNVELVADVLNYYMTKGSNHNKGLGPVVDKWVWDWVTQGSGILKGRWDVQYSKFLDVVMVQEEAESIFQVNPETGEESQIPQYRMVEKEIEKVKKCFDGPVFELVNLEDILILGGDGDPDLADAVLQRSYMTASQLWTLVDRKVFNADAVEEVIKSGPDKQEGGLGNDIKSIRSVNAGQGRLDGEEDLDRYEIIEAHMRLDIDGSGINADIVAWVHPKAKSILAATYLYRQSKGGMRPFAKADFMKRKGQEFGVGIVEMLYPLSRELDAMHNMKVDFGMISTAPFAFYRPSSGIDPETIAFQPGALIPVDNPQTDVVFPQIGNRSMFGAQEEQSIQMMVERLTSISDLNLGLTTSQGATRTATGARAVMNEMSSNLDVHLRRLNEGWNKVLSYMFESLQMRIPAGTVFRLTGHNNEQIFRTINSAKELDGEFDIEVSSNTSNSNPGIQQGIASQIMQQVADPLAIQLGIVTPAQYYNAKMNLLKAFGVRDAGKFLLKPQGPLRIYTPEEEANRLLRGEQIPVSPEMDHEGYIAYVDQIFATDELLGQFSEQQAITLEVQKRKHAQMLQAIQQMQAEQRNQAQMASNSTSGDQQTTQMAPGAGGQ